MAKECKGCVYWRSISSSSSTYQVCHYLLDTGNPRGCEPGERCIKRREKPRRSGNSIRGKEKNFVFSLAESEEMSSERGKEIEKPV